MSSLATLYLPVRSLPQPRHLTPLAPGAHVEVDPDASTASITWPDLTITLRRLADEELPQQLTGLQEYARKRGGSDAVATRILSTLSVLAVVIEPGFDDAGRAIGVVAGLANLTDGLAFLEGDLLDSAGRSLLTSPMVRPTAGRVAARAIALLALSMRGLFEQDAGSPEEAGADALRRDLVAWVKRWPQVEVELDRHEAELLATPLGCADKQAILNAVWRAEGAQVLLWSLGARDLPAHDAQEHPFEVARDAQVLMGDRPRLFDATLRTADEIDRMRLRLLAIHWRLVEARLRPERAVALSTLAEKPFLRGVDLTGVATLEGDLALRGEPITRAAATDRARAMSIARERRHAANWLIGVHPIYARVITPT